VSVKVLASIDPGESDYEDDEDDQGAVRVEFFPGGDKHRNGSHLAKLKEAL